MTLSACRPERQDFKILLVDLFSGVQRTSFGSWHIFRMLTCLGQACLCDQEFLARAKFELSNDSKLHISINSRSKVLFLKAFSFALIRIWSAIHVFALLFEGVSQDQQAWQSAIVAACDWHDCAV
jgi:hypothetical protein